MWWRMQRRAKDRHSISKPTRFARGAVTYRELGNEFSLVNVSVSLLKGVSVGSPVWG